MWLMWLMMKNTLGDELMYNSNSVRNNENVIIVGNKGVFKHNHRQSCFC